MKNIRSILIRIQPSPNNFLVTLKFFSKKLINEFKNFLLKKRVNQLFKGNFAERITRQTFSVGYEVNSKNKSDTLKYIEIIKEFCKNTNILLEQKKLGTFNNKL